MRDAFATLLAVLAFADRAFPAASPRVGRVLAGVLALDWRAKIKYRPLRLLLSHTDACALLRAHPETLDELVVVLGRPLASPSAADLVAELVIGSRSSAGDQWEALWVPQVVGALTGGNAGAVAMLDQHALRPIVDAHPDVLQRLLRAVIDQGASEDRVRHFFFFFCLSRAR